MRLNETAIVNLRRTFVDVYGLDNVRAALDTIAGHLTDEMYVRLECVFGTEWAQLDPADQALIVRDCTEEGGVDDLPEYRQNIGAGNLGVYVRTQRVRFGVK